MNSLGVDNFVLSCEDYGLTIGSDESINKLLPFDLVKKTMSYLSRGDIETVSVVCRSWQKASTETARQSEYYLMRNLAQKLGKLFSKSLYSDEGERFYEIAKNKEVLNSKNLIQINSAVDRLRKDFINVLKKLEVKDLKFLDLVINKKNTTIFSASIFKLTIIYQEIDKVKNFTDTSKKDTRFREICSSLVKFGRCNKALEIVNEIQDRISREFAFKEIAELLVNRGEFGKGEKIINEITDSYIKSLALRALVSVLVGRGDFERAKDVANSIPNKITKEFALSFCQQTL